LPGWYLPKGIKNAEENELENASSSFERWSIWFGALVILAVSAEFIIAFFEPPYSLFLRLSLPADAGVALGIVGEVLFAMMDNRIQTELRSRSNDKLGIAEKDAAEARERTAQVEKLTAWRRVSPEQQRQIADAIRVEMAFPLDVHIESERGDAEAFSYALGLSNIFKDAGIEEVSGQPNSWLGWQKIGLYVAASPGFNLSLIIEAFGEAKIRMNIKELPFGLPTIASPRA
jgi:hypothetical protein